MAISYTRTEFARLIGINPHTLVRWEKTGKLKPAGYNSKKAFYTDEQLAEVRKKSRDTIIGNDSTWVDFCNIPLDSRGIYSWKAATKKKCKIPYRCENKEGIITLLEYDGMRFEVDIDGRESSISRPQLRKANIANTLNCTCTDGIRYPNKFMLSVCEQLYSAGNIINYEREYSPKWAIGEGKKHRYKYDFLIKINDKTKIIVEMDSEVGHGHRTIDKNLTPEETLAIDKEKDMLAFEHGLTVIRIDAQKSEREYIKKNIISMLSTYINFTDIDWGEADEFATKNFVKTVCLYYAANQPMTTKELAKVFHIHQGTAKNYVKRGEKLGWCEYNYKLLYANMNKRRHLEMIKNMVRICLYYEKHRPILAKDIAKRFNMYLATVLKYLDRGVAYGFTPYDREYSKQLEKERLKKVRAQQQGHETLCFSLEKNLLKRYNSVAEAAKEMNLKRKNINQCCIHKGTSSGYIFRFADDCEIDY